MALTDDDSRWENSDRNWNFATCLLLPRTRTQALMKVRVVAHQQCFRCEH